MDTPSMRPLLRCRICGFQPRGTAVSQNTKNSQAGVPDARRDFWLRQYATAFTSGDKRAAAVALQFAQQYNRPVIVATPKDTQQRG
jgi:hypothetical protein